MKKNEVSDDTKNLISYICENEYGHTHWAFTDALSDAELKEIKDKKLCIKLPSIVIYYE